MFFYNCILNSNILVVIKIQILDSFHLYRHLHNYIEKYFDNFILDFVIFHTNFISFRDTILEKCFLFVN